MPGLWLHELLWLWLLLGGCLAGKILGFLCSCQCRLLGLLLGFLGCLHKGFGRGLTCSKRQGLASEDTKTHLTTSLQTSPPVSCAPSKRQYLPRVQIRGPRLRVGVATAPGSK